MKATNKLTRFGTCGFIAATLGLTLPLTANVIAAEVSEKAAVIAVLHLSPDGLLPEIEAEMNRRRFAVAEGDLPVTAITEWPGMKSQRALIKLMDDGQTEAIIYDDEGFELGAAEKAVKLASFAPLIDLCRAHAGGNTGEDYYKMPAGSTGLIYNANCKPKVKPAGNVDIDAKIAALMADEDIDIETRKAKALGMKLGYMLAEFKRKNPNPTRQEEYDNCIYIAQNTWTIYRNDTDQPVVQQEMRDFCEEDLARKRGPRPE